MSQDKRERHRVKRERKRRQQHRRAAQLVQGVGRHARVAALVATADDAVAGCAFTTAAEAMATACRLLPRDIMLAGNWLYAAERTRNAEHHRAALEHHCRLVEPDVTALLLLAWLNRATGLDERALELARQARAAFPRRMRQRARWLAVLEDLERSLLVDSPAPTPARRECDATLPLFPADTPTPAVGTVPRRPTAPPEPIAAVPAAVPSVAAAVAPHDRPKPAPVRSPTVEIPMEVAADIDGIASLERRAWDAADDVRLAVLAAQIRDAESFDRLLAVENARGVLRLSHQEETARKVLSVLLGRALLADEVGLGKTIEAGLVLAEYLLRGRVDRVLILVPPTLVAQWREELGAKFGIVCRTTEEASFRNDPGRFWSDRGVAIASLATARSARQREGVAAKAWDLVIVDEAHGVKNARTESHALVARLESRFLLLLTATPIENRVEELYNLVSLIRPGQLGGRREFVRRFSDSKGRLTEAARRDVRALLSEVMIRNTRALSGVHLPPRFAKTVLVEPRGEERELYAHLVAALRALGTGGQTRMLMSVLLQEAGSSPDAVRLTLEKVRAEATASAAAREALTPAIECAAAVTDTAKGAALLRALQPAEPAVVFTRFRATLDFLAALLAQHRIPFERVDGDVPPARRAEAIARLREGGGVLLSTDVGSEGLNLQCCRRVINFDLPWNPMRIEQRIGRVHRIGQEHPVEVVNLCLAGSVEERILHVLDERINLFELVVGEVEMILGYLEDAREFPDLMLEAFAEPDAESRERSFTRIADQLAAARRRYVTVKTFDEEFFRNELGV